MVDAVALLFEVSGSVLSAVTVTLLLFVPAVSRVSAMASPSVAPLAREAIVQTMGLPLAHSFGREVTVVPGGTVIVALTFRASTGPALLIVAVKTTLEPTTAAGFDACMATDRSAVSAVTTLVVALLVLFAAFGSCGAATVTLLVTLPAEDGARTRATNPAVTSLCCSTATAGCRSCAVQVIVPDPPVEGVMQVIAGTLLPFSAIERKVVPEGVVQVKVIVPLALGPPPLALTVYEKSAPTTTCAGALLVTETSELCVPCAV